MAKNNKKITPLPELSEGVEAFDTHCHLDMSAYGDDCEAVISEAFAVGVKKIVTVGIDLKSSHAAVKIAERYKDIYASVGVHPHNVEMVSEDDYRQLEALAKHPKVVAYGEVGMDTVKKYAANSLQQTHFCRQVELAKELDLPLIVHDREAHDEVMTILKAAAPFKAGGIMHCYSGDMVLANEILALGFLISIPGVVTFNNAVMMQEVAREIPLSAMVVETDGPYLAPVPRRGKRNKPSYVLYTAQKIAELRGIRVDEVLRQTTINAMELFGIGTDG